RVEGGALAFAYLLRRERNGCRALLEEQPGDVAVGSESDPPRGNRVLERHAVDIATVLRADVRHADELTRSHYCPVKNLGNSIGYRRVQLRNRRPREKMPSGSRSFQKPPPKRPAAMCREAPPAGAVCARSQPAHRPKRRSRFASSRRSPTCHRTV